MPVVSEAQRRLMEAAAHTPGGVGGVSQAVGKEFEAADMGGKLPARAAKKKPGGMAEIHRMNEAERKGT
jgi:hypothetical protein